MTLKKCKKALKIFTFEKTVSRDPECSPLLIADMMSDGSVLKTTKKRVKNYVKNTIEKKTFAQIEGLKIDKRY